MKLNGARNQCPTCREYFNSNGAFDKHRTGPHGVYRRCRTPEEMQEKGMSLRKDGFWIADSMSADLVAIHEERKNENQHA
jgi:hypothetical protein